ncbi:pectinesterase family protein [Streptomyces boninensis]|uniref:pectinesterase family protein n=1 Tax=Streptomyces boninensis TaxID=2039455 RepID=UPI003B21058F
MSDPRRKHRNRRLRTLRNVAIPLAVITAGGLTYGFAAADDSGTEPGAKAAVAAWADDTADGFASVEAEGQKGTYGGRDGKTVTVKTLAELEKYAIAEEPYTIIVAGKIDMDPVGKEIKVASDKTIVGAGTEGHIVGGGFFLGEGVHNVIIRNLTIRDSYQGTWNDKEHDFDAIQMDGAHHVWIDHNDLRHMADGLIDSRKDTTNVTVSYNRLSTNNKAFGIGWTENVTADLTIHHNWIRETEQRNPSTDNAEHAHLYNNYLQDDPGTEISSSYGNYSRGATKMVLENSYFQGFTDPVTKDEGAEIVQRGNVFKDTSGRNEKGGSAFDPKDFYDYELDPADGLPALLATESGPQGSIGTTTGTTAKGVTADTKAVAAEKTLTVAKDGSGQYESVQKAIDAVPAGNKDQITIAVAPGTYRELVKIPSNKPNITVQGTGESNKDAVIVYNNASGTPKPDGSGNYGTSGSATMHVEANDVRLQNLTVSNDFDEKKNQGVIKDQQAVALRTIGDRIQIVDALISGDQDTLLMDSPSKDVRSRVYITGSTITGNVDFIFGRATAVVDRSVITLKKRWNGDSGGYVTAPSTAAGRNGILISRSTVNGDVSGDSFHLGRPWHAGGDAALDPQTTVRDSTLSGAIKDAPWTDMSGFSWKDDRFAEYQNSGDGAGKASEDRPILSDAQAAQQEIADWLGDWTPGAV